MKIFLFLMFIIVSTWSHAQDFPAKFTGRWQGELLWYQQGKKDPQKVKMQLIIQPADTAGQYTWQLIYGDKNEDNRPYLLKPVDTAQGHWVVDERDGIQLDQYWLANRFTTSFTVQNSTILTSYYLQGDNLIAEFYAMGTKPVTTSGGTSQNVPSVTSFSIKNYQKAILTKQ
jgi:hypothetical protein